jgi:hypothetical protein
LLVVHQEIATVIDSADITVIGAQGWATGYSAGTVEQPGRNVAREVRTEPCQPQYTSQTCPNCGHACPENRRTQAVFPLRPVCCYGNHADVVGAINVGISGPSGRGGCQRRNPVYCSFVMAEMTVFTFNQSFPGRPGKSPVYPGRLTASRERWVGKRSQPVNRAALVGSAKSVVIGVISGP